MSLQLTLPTVFANSASCREAQRDAGFTPASFRIPGLLPRLCYFGEAASREPRLERRDPMRAPASGDAVRIKERLINGSWTTRGLFRATQVQRT
jgi:hypothetical protein